MADPAKIKEINKILEEYFTQNDTINIIPVKALMPAFISAGIFKKDKKSGMPIRKILRDLDKEKQLELIPYVHADRQEQSVYWYFIPLNSEAPTTAYKQEVNDGLRKNKEKKQNDESYIIDLCNKVLEQNAFRKKKFDFLLGDFHKDGESKTNIPVDAYYEELKLAIMYQPKWTESENANPKESKKTVSGMSRAEQRERYHNRKMLTLPKHGIDAINLTYSNFSCGDDHKIIRNEEADIQIIRKKLGKYLD